MVVLSQMIGPSSPGPKYLLARVVWDDNSFYMFGLDVSLHIIVYSFLSTRLTSIKQEAVGIFC